MAKRTHHQQQQSGLARTVERCPTCGQRRRHVRRYYEWHDVQTTCCGCGSSWEGMHRIPQTAAERARDARLARSAWIDGKSVSDALGDLMGGV
jgi:hypothetical protein